MFTREYIPQCWTGTALLLLRQLNVNLAPAHNAAGRDGSWPQLCVLVSVIGTHAFTCTPVFCVLLLLFFFLTWWKWNQQVVAPLIREKKVRKGGIVGGRARPPLECRSVAVCEKPKTCMAAEKTYSINFIWICRKSHRNHLLSACC